MRHALTSTPPSRGHHGPLIAIVAVACALGVMACGSSSPSPGAAGPNGATRFIKFAGCMRAHGVPNFPDPSGGGGIHIQVGSGINPQSPAFQAAQTSCAKLLPGGLGSRHPTERDKLLMLQISECMRQHGVSGFPDPILTPPASPAGDSLLENRGGVILAIPNTIDIASPVFKQAAATCGFR
jgi:hypothetical protein